MTYGRWGDDEWLLEEIGEALHGPGPVRPDYREAGREAFAWRVSDAGPALASLAYDTALDEEPALAYRSHGPARTLVFSGAELSVEIEITEAELLGQLSPPQPGRVTVLAPDGRIEEVAADEIGCFLLARPRGPVRLRCRAASGIVVTEWVAV